MKSIHSIFMFGLLLVCMPVAGHAQDAEGYCHDAQTTADLVKCTHTRVQQENEKLLRLFNTVTSEYTETEAKKRLADNQTDWLAYRTETCDVESSQFEGGSLETVQKLACVGRVTAERIKHFEVLLNERDPSTIPVYSNPPRWMNVLGADYKDIFWHIASKQYADTDCDGVNEVLLRGIKPMENGTYKNVWAIADSEKTGRPKVSLVQSDDIKDCQVLPDFKMVRIPITKPLDASNGKQCSERLSLVTTDCGEFTINYDNATELYQLQNNQ